MIDTPALAPARPCRATSRRVVVAACRATAALLLTAAHWYDSRLPISASSLFVSLDSLFSLLFVGALFLLAWAIGARLLGALAIPWQSQVEAAVFGIACGLAVLSYLTFTLACLGLLNAAVGAGALIILSMLVRRELSTCAVLFAQSVRSLRHVSFGQQRVATGVSAIAALLLLISVSIALLPPFSYDALWYLSLIHI